ncbi:hypothetical protein BGZ98_002855, partial [Dissophora globulifera]
TPEVPEADQRNRRIRRDVDDDLTLFVSSEFPAKSVEQDPLYMQQLVTMMENLKVDKETRK